MHMHVSLCVCVFGVCVYRSEDNFREESVLSSIYVQFSQDQTQVVRLGDKTPRCPLSLFGNNLIVCSHAGLCNVLVYCTVSWVISKIYFTKPTEVLTN